MTEHVSPATQQPSRVSLADGVYDIVLEQLVDGTIAAGSSLNIDALAREMNVSQTPIREALARLESTGLVTRAVLKGYRAAPLFTERELLDLMDARAAIEPTSAYLACGRAPSRLITELSDSISALEDVVSGRASAEYHNYREADERFHMLISAASENRFLQAAYASLGGQVQRFRLFGALGMTDTEFAIAEHTEILHAFEKGNAELARDAMARHIANARDRARIDREALAK